MMPVNQPQRLFETAAGWIRFWARIQFAQNAIPGAHDFLAHNFLEGLKCGFQDFSPVAMVKTSGRFIEDIGAETQPLFRIRKIIGSDRCIPAGIVRKPDLQEFLKNLPSDSVQKTDREKAELVRQVCLYHLERSIPCP